MKSASNNSDIVYMLIRTFALTLSQRYETNNHKWPQP